MSEDIPPGYKLEEGIAYGSRLPGLLEIKFHNPKKRNSITGAGQNKLGSLIEKAQNDTSIKVIFVHGGTNYTAGNDLTVFGQHADKSKEEQRAISSLNTEHYMVQ